MSVQSIERAFSILRALALGPMGVTRIAEHVALPKSTVARLLAALETEGAVAQVEGGTQYLLGEGLVDIAGSIRPGRNLITTVRPHLLELTAELGETSGLSIESAGAVYYLDHVESGGDVQVRNWTGESLPSHTVPSGICFMAHWPDRKLDAYLDAELEAATAYTLVEADAIRDRLAQVRSLGYAWGYEEGVDGINSVAAPIFEPDGSVAAAIHVHGPAYRFPDPDQVHDLGVLVIGATTSAAELLVD